MLRFVRFSVLACALAAAPALGADLPSRAPPPVAPFIAPIPAFSWTGAYVGGNIGGGFLADDVVGIHYNPGKVFAGNFGKLQPSGLMGGAQAGYNYQWGHVVVGAEADFQGSQIQDTASASLAPYAIGTLNSKSTVDYFGTARVRLGYAFDRTLLYATGGYSYTDVRYDVTGRSTTGFSAALHDRSIHSGDALGAGIEFAFTDHLTAKLEFQHIGASSKTASTRILRGTAATRYSIYTVESPEFQTARLGINYKF